MNWYLDTLSCGYPILKKANTDSNTIFVDFHIFLTIFDDFPLKLLFYIWKLSRDGVGLVQDIFGNIFHLGNLPEDHILNPKTSDFWFLGPQLKMSILTLCPKPTFWVTNPSIHAVQNVRMDHRDHFRFHHFFEFDLIFVTPVIKIYVFSDKHIVCLDFCKNTCKSIGDMCRFS